MSADRKAKTPKPKHLYPSDKAGIDAMNAVAAVLTASGKTKVILEEGDEAATPLDPRSAALHFVPWKYRTSEGPEPLFSAWLESESRRHYVGIGFAPGEDIRPKYNVWRGPAIEPDPSADWSRAEALIRFLCGHDDNNYKYAMTYLAHAAQHPSDKLDTSLVIAGQKGNGKSSLGELLKAIWPNHVAILDSTERLIPALLNSDLV